MAYRAVCVSRDLGAAGEEVGRLVADRLGFRYVDGEVLALAAERGEFDPDELADAERRQGLIDRALLALAGTASPEAVAFAPSIANPSKPREAIRDAIEEIAGDGEVVIVAHAASHALSDRGDVLRVLVTGSRDRRAERVAADEGTDGHAAERIVDDGDRARADYLKRFYGISSEGPEQYDLVVNTDRMAPETAAGLIGDLAQR